MRKNWNGIDLPAISCAVAFFVALIGVPRAPAQPAMPPEDLLICRAGDTPVTLFDVVLYRRMERERLQNAGPSANQALRQLVENALEQEAANKFNIKIGADDLKKLNAQFESNAQTKADIERIKQSLGDQQEYFDKLYSRPMLIRSKLHELLENNEQLQLKAQKAINDAWQQAEAGGDFAKIAGEQKLLHQTIQLGMQDKNTPLLQIAQSLEPGKIHPSIVVSVQEYSILRLAEKNAAGYKLEAIVARKQGYDEWLRESCRPVRIHFIDEQLLAHLRADFPEIWWAKQIAG